MKKYLFVLLAIFTSCESGKEYRDRQLGSFFVCNESQNNKVAEFIKSSIGNANNHSDEEMEDVIFQLEKTAKNTFCKRIFMLNRTADSLVKIDSIYITDAN